MNNGTGPTRISKKDYDFHRSFGTVGTTPNFPLAYFTDAGLWMPNQNTDEPIFKIPMLPFGCTDYTQADLANDINNQLVCNPFDLDQVTNANARGGYDIRQSLLAAIKMRWINGFFNIRPHQLDFFDSIRLAMISGIPEKRSVSIGNPWFPLFEEVKSDGILQIPRSLNTAGVGWHNHKICGWKIINGETYLISKSWQGKLYGNQGYCYWSRALLNSVMAIPGTVAFTATKGVLPPISTISAPLWDWLVSNIKSLLGYSY